MESHINIMQQLYEDSSCQIIHKGKLTNPFTVKTRVRQGWMLSPTFFPIVMDWIMRGTTEGSNTAFQWTFTKQLEDLDFAEDAGNVASRSDDRPTLVNVIRINCDMEKTGLDGILYYFLINSACMICANATFTEVPKDVSVGEGDDVEMPCTFKAVSSAPMSLEIQWWYLKKDVSKDELQITAPTNRAETVLFRRDGGIFKYCSVMSTMDRLLCITLVFMHKLLPLLLAH
ncbi:uncharacterized protein LOC102796111 [Neolamprologus brichardi]|uniref:uncharacterized protein LOC102796111 n=1 Tax=Neolamprologus brichardi TaxID=32507 RepID=UPI0016439AF2|nr:uncharacterized protein LOC102796111 [Neolamprologus brichardi]